jgi:hypothetical protein
MLRRFFVVFALILATIQAVAQTAPPAAQVVKYYACGFQVGVPTPFKSKRMQARGRLIADIYVTNGLAFMLGINTGDSLDTVEAQIRKDKDTLSLEKIGTTTDAGVQLQGINAVGNMASVSGDPLELEVMGNSKQARVIMFDREIGGSNVMVVGLGPVKRSADIESLARQVVGSLKAIDAGDTQPAGIAAPNKGQLNKGETMLVGTVESLKSDSRSFTLLASKTVAWGRKATELKPPKRRTVVLAQPDAQLVLGAKLAVIGSDKGAKTPLNARLIQLLN